MRYSQQLLFMVAGIEALEERSNQLGRTIFNAVAWVVNPHESNIISDDEELMLRHLAARSLLSFVGKDPEFINTINEAIDFKGLEEFEVKIDKIDQLTDENSPDKLKQLLPNLDKAEADQQIWYKKVEKTSNEQEIISLAEKIINTGLPEEDLAILIRKVDGNAVSVSPIDLDLKTETPPVSQVKEVTTPTENIVQNVKNTEVVEDTPEKSKSKRKQLLLLIIIIISFLVLILFSLKMMENQEKEPEKIPTPQTMISPQTTHSIQ
jgi:hypothetical protein